jgi:adenosylcobyric acid synthase
MLGNSIADPAGIEGPPATCEGLGLLDVATQLTGAKLLVEVAGTRMGGAPFKGYEMHVGRTDGADCVRPMLRFADGRIDGAASADGLIEGCYVHGLFVDDAHRSDWLARLGAGTSVINYEDVVEKALDDLAQHLERHIDCDALLGLARAPRLTASATA